MPGIGNKDYNGVIPWEGGKAKSQLKWNKFKWILFAMNTLVSDSLWGMVM